MKMKSFLLLLVLLFCCYSSIILVNASHAGGVTYSAVPMTLPSSKTDYSPLIGPQATNYDYQIYVAFKAYNSTDIMVTTFNWNTDRTWTTPTAIDNAASYGGASLIEFTGDPVAIWSDAETSTLTFSTQNTNTGVWGQLLTSTYPCHPSPPCLYTPPEPTMVVFYRGPTSEDLYFNNCTYDEYTVFDTYPSTLPTYSHGSAAVDNVDSYTYLFYIGVDASGVPDGYLHYAKNNQQTGAWTDDMTLPYYIDDDSTISANYFWNSTNQYIWIYYKYDSTIMWIEYDPGTQGDGNGIFYPTEGNLGFNTQLNTTSGPSAAIYYDPFYDSVVASVFFTAWSSTTNDLRVFNAIGIPDNWP